MKEQKKSPEEYLKENGPSTQEEVPVQIRARHRYESGIERLLIRPNSRVLGWGRQTPVYYHETEGAEAVIRKYLEVNPQLLDMTQGALTSLFGRGGSYFKEAWLNISKEYETKETQNGGSRAGYTQCPFCDTEVFNSNLPDHIVEKHAT